ncbi:protein NLP2-like [Chenopodium quinoa]|uniref:protein NLP2-like n=1 Tax=Chenopodium quinoa TaxID=63459 RepID=UPI000B77683C|nr:protein NLP2-like [Chenopodium quinoa]XP_021774357.1 protein NLP2-like [Chenopodium quinoa]XP_021774361.1 protein NLP2-like [Chenopodium quinoa]XP_021774368.1 protein NLP2-like [Chenopodium quinoa]
MDDGSFNPTNNPPVFGNIDYDLMEQLLDDGCWLQTADGSNLLQSGTSQGQGQGPISPSTSRGLSYPSSFSFPSLEPVSSSLTSPGNQLSSYREKWSPKEEQAVDSENQDDSAITPAAAVLNQSRSFSWEGNELNRILWIGPKANSGASTSVRERLMRAVTSLRDLNRNRDVLIQIWVPIKKGLKSFLTTVEQPYFHQPSSTRLLHYRDVSEKYEFLADEDTKQAHGLPGRVFLGKVPEWTPDVRYFRTEEYPRQVYARQFDVRGSIALPVFEKGSGDSLGVVEIIMTTDKFDYRPEIESVCKALETVHLRSSEILDTPPEQSGKRTYDAVEPEILTVVRAVCDSLDLPLAQTWAPCSQQGKGGCWHSENNVNCVSIIDSACYVRDQRVMDFHKACSDHHLLRSQGGIVGKAFDTNQPCYATDITEFSKVEYPLSHHARMIGLRGAVAVRLRSIYHEKNDYVLEFYLPSNVQEKGLAFHSRIWQSVSVVIQQHCRYLNFITDNDFEQKLLFPGKPAADSETKETSWFSQMMEPQRKGKEVVVSLEFGEDEPSKGFKVMNWSDNEPSLQLGQALSDSENINQDSGSKGISGTSSGGRLPLSARSEKRRTKTQKTISLDVLRQYFAGSLKDAARSIGVCPTTLKRICRQHGIARWPSRKIKKVDHSLRKLQLVIDSVQGAEGSIQLSSFYSKFPELNSPTTQPKQSQVSSINLNNQPKQQPTTQPEGTIHPTGGTNSNSPASTSSSQTSTSSYCFSSGAKMSSPVTTIASGSKDASTTEDPSSSLKRARSEAELQVLISSKKEASQILERSQSNKTLAEHPSFETLPPLPITKSWLSREAGVFKAKATFGDEKVRFSILPNMGFLDLQQEIVKRFNLEDLSKMGIKYLDDDKEWVLLTCDADLEECIDIHKSSGSHTIKLSICPLSSLASSFGSSGLS